MLKMPDTKGKYFSVKHSTKIQGAHYTPCVCYQLSQGLQAIVEEMAAKDMAKIYPEKVRFVTGVPYPVKDPAAGQAAERSSSASTPETPTDKPAAQKAQAASEKPGRKSGRSAYTSQTRR